MNRRHFMRSLAVAAAGFTILPPATTYSRVWRASREPVVAYFFMVENGTTVLSAPYLKAMGAMGDALEGAIPLTRAGVTNVLRLWERGVRLTTTPSVLGGVLNGPGGRKPDADYV